MYVWMYGYMHTEPVSKKEDGEARNMNRNRNRNRNRNPRGEEVRRSVRGEGAKSKKKEKKKKERKKERKSITFLHLATLPTYLSALLRYLSIRCIQ